MKKLISFIVIISLLITSQSAQATFFTDLFGGLFTVMSYPFQLLLGSTKAPFFVSQNPFVEKEWHKEERLAATHTHKPPEEPQSPTATPKDNNSKRWFIIEGICFAVGAIVGGLIVGGVAGAAGVVALPVLKAVARGATIGVGAAAAVAIGAVARAKTREADEGEMVGVKTATKAGAVIGTTAIAAIAVARTITAGVAAGAGALGAAAGALGTEVVAATAIGLAGETGVVAVILKAGIAATLGTIVAGVGAGTAGAAALVGIIAEAKFGVGRARTAAVGAAVGATAIGATTVAVGILNAAGVAAILGQVAIGFAGIAAILEVLNTAAGFSINKKDFKET
jgi:hypothetical protein